MAMAAARHLPQMSLKRQAPTTGKGSSNIGKDVEIFVILVFAPFSFAKVLFRFDEFYAFYPLHHFIPKLVFNAQSQGAPYTSGSGTWFIS